MKTDLNKATEKIAQAATDLERNVREALKLKQNCDGTSEDWEAWSEALADLHEQIETTQDKINFEIN